MTLKLSRYDLESLPVQNGAASLKVTEVDWNAVLACKTRRDVINFRASVPSLRCNDYTTFCFWLGKLIVSNFNNSCRQALMAATEDS